LLDIIVKVYQNVDMPKPVIRHEMLVRRLAEPEGERFAAATELLRIYREILVLAQPWRIHLEHFSLFRVTDQMANFLKKLLNRIKFIQANSI
jgi:hypothetical protein